MTWPRTPARFLLTEVDERGLRPGDEGELLSVSEYRGVVPRTTSASQQAASEDTSHYKRCEPGQLVLNRLWAFRGGLGVSSLTGLVSPDYAVFDIDPAMDPRFVHYQTRSSWFVAEMTKRLRGIGSPDASNGRAPRINTDDLGRIEMYTPALSVQRAVADTLDREAARVSTIMQKREELIGRLQLRMRATRAALLQEVRETIPLRFAADELTEQDEGPLRDVLTLDRVESWTARVLPFDGSDDAGSEAAVGKRFAAGDVLYSKLRPYLAKAVLATTDGLANSEFIVYRPRPGLDAEYLHQALLAPPFVSWTNAMSYGTKMPRTNPELMGRYKLPLPDLRRQRRIVEELSEVGERIDNVVRTITHQGELLSKRCDALFLAAMNSQIAV